MVVALAMLPACNPYQNFDGEFYAGPIDATNFAGPYLGALPGNADQGGGVIAASNATAAGVPVMYYMFPFTDSQNGQDDPLTINSGAAPAPKAYAFDPGADDAMPAKPRCAAPSHYIFDQRTEAYRLDQQGIIFTSLPSAGGYVPVVSEQKVTSVSEKCQDIKSKKTVVSTRSDVTVDKDVDGKYGALAIIDPSADVQPNFANGLGPIQLGWYNQYLVAVIDGGYVPTEDVAMAGMTPAYTRMVAQTLYAPTQIPGMDANMNPVPVAGGQGTGFDILDAARGAQGYSPVWHVLTYVPDDPLNPKTSATDLSATELASAGAADADKGYVFCFQPF